MQIYCVSSGVLVFSQAFLVSFLRADQRNSCCDAGDALRQNKHRKSLTNHVELLLKFFLV